MTTSQNGWDTLTRAECKNLTVPGTKVVLPLSPVAGPVLISFAAAFHHLVQPLVAGDCWGYADRDIRGSTTVISNHASGTAIDLNASKHPLASTPSATYTAAQIATIHTLLAENHSLIRWGGDYVGRKDGMHFEINVTPSHFPAQGQPTPPFPGVLKYGDDNGHVYTAKLRLIHLGVKMALDTHYDQVMVSAVTHFQSTHGLAIDGSVGPATWAALWA